MWLDFSVTMQMLNLLNPNRKNQAEQILKEQINYFFEFPIIYNILQWMEIFHLAGALMEHILKGSAPLKLW